MSYQKIIIAGLLAGVCNTSLASGFALSGKSASNLGTALSGTTVMADDASVVHSNPAAMRYLEGQHLSAVFHFVNTDLTFDNDGSTASGSDSKSVTKTHFIPNFYYLKTLNEDVTFGLGMYSPFGLGIDYGDEWVGRYHSTNSSLRTINISPTIAFSPSDKLNLGFGVDFQYAEAELSKTMDFAYICSAYGVPGCTDGSNTLSGDSWGIGYSLGLTYDLSEATRLGASFHSSTRQNLEGDSKFEGVPGMFSSYFSDSGASLTLMLPESLSLGVKHIVTPKLEIMADYTWTRWSRYDATVVDFDNNLPLSSEISNWKDSNRYAIGMNYRMRDNLQLRSGLTYDQTPIPDAEHRTPRVPDTDKMSVGLGGKVGLSDNMDLDLALFYTLPADSDIKNSDNFDNTLEGSFETQTTYVSMQLNWKL